MALDSATAAYLSGGGTLSNGAIPTTAINPSYDPTVKGSSSTVAYTPPSPKVQPTTISGDQSTKIADNTQKTQDINTGIAQNQQGNKAAILSGGFQYWGDGTTPMNAPADAVQQQDADGHVWYTSGGKNYAVGPDTGLSPEQQQNQDTIAKLQSQSDTYFSGAMASVKAAYDSLIAQQKQINAGAEASVSTASIASGSSRYDPVTAAGNMQATMSFGLQKISDLTSKEMSAISELNKAQLDKNFELADKKISEINKIRDSKQVAAKKLQDDLVKTTQDVREAAVKKAQQDIDNTLASDKFTYQQKQDVIDNAFKQGQITETERHNKATELAASQATSGGSGIGGMMPSVSMTAGGKPNSVEQANFLSKFPPIIADAIKGLASYDINPSSFSTSKKQAQGGLTQGELVTLAKQYDPTYSESQYATRQAYIKNVQQGQIYQGIIAANKSINHLVAFNDSVAGIGNSGVSSSLNALGTAIEKPFSSKLQQNVTTAKTEATGLKDELAKFFKGTGTTDVTSIDNWSKALDPNATPGSQKGTVQGAITLLAGQLDVLNQQYQQTMGKAPGNTFLQPATIQKLSILKNKGFQVDIPGVNYTDKDAYFTYGGGTPDDLAKARQTLVNANDPTNPPTPENILELSQIQ